MRLQTALPGDPTVEPTIQWEGADLTDGDEDEVQDHAECNDANATVASPWATT